MIQEHTAQENKVVLIIQGTACSSLAVPCMIRTDEDASDLRHLHLTFEEWDPSTDTDASQDPLVMIVNSSELCNVGFDLREVIPLQIETTRRGGQCSRDATLK